MKFKFYTIKSLRALLLSLIYIYTLIKFNNPVYAGGWTQIINPVLPSGLGAAGASGEQVIGVLVARALAAALGAGSIAFLLYLVFGAFRWLTAGDNKTQLESARNTIAQALVGLIILASIFAIGRIVGMLLGLECEGYTFPDVICWPNLN